MSYDFETQTFAKWILAGEHAVLRGHPALVFPIPDQRLTLCYQRTSLPLQVIADGASSVDWPSLIQRLLTYAQSHLNLSFTNLSGTLLFRNEIPVGVGLGASAALCVAIARWLHYLDDGHVPEVNSTARQLEHFFHGQSSGLDIAGVSSSTGQWFQQGASTPLHQTWQPQWTLSSCEEQGHTADCIDKVQLLWKTNPIKAEQLDQRMHHCVLLARDALATGDREQLAQAINQACDCFAAWGLITDPLAKHLDAQRNAGALAVKPTGSGGGGYVLSLWA